jgi:hypothetical protein
MWLEFVRIASRKEVLMPDNIENSDTKPTMEESITDLLSGGEEDQDKPTEDGEETSGGESEDEVVADTDDLESEDSGDTPSTKVKVGDVEYDPDELNTLLEKGKLAKQVEEEQNVDISKLYPEFTRRSQLLKNPEGLKQYVKETFGFDINAPTETLTEEEKVLQEQIQKAREAGFLVREDTEEIIGSVMEAIELRDLKSKVDVAVAKHGLEPKELIDFMTYLNTRDADSAAEKLKVYKDVQAGKVATTAKPKVVPKKPDVIKTETKGGGTRVPPKEKPLPHPDKDPDAYARRIMEFLEPKAPEDV